MAGRHAPHLRLSVPPRLAPHPSFRFPSTPLPTPSKALRGGGGGLPSSPYVAALLRLLALHALFLLGPAARPLPSLAHTFLLPPLLALLSAAVLLLHHLSVKTQQPHHPFPALSSLLRPALVIALSLFLRIVALRVLPSPGLVVLADPAGALSARALRRPSHRRVLAVSVAALSLVFITPSAAVLLAIPFASGFLSSAEHSATARHATRSSRARAAAVALAAAFLVFPALVGLFFLGSSDASDGDGAVPLGRLWWLLLNAAVFGMTLGQRQEHEWGNGTPSMDFAMTFLSTVVLELVYYPKMFLPGFLICGFLLWIASRELAPAGYIELGSADVSESVYEAVMGPVRHIMSERKSRKIAEFLLINTAYYLRVIFFDAMPLCTTNKNNQNESLLPLLNGIQWMVQGHKSCH